MCLEQSFAVPPHTCCVGFPAQEPGFTITVFFRHRMDALIRGSSLDTWPCTKTLSQPSMFVQPSRNEVTSPIKHSTSGRLWNTDASSGIQGTRCSCGTLSRLGEPLIIRQQHRRAEERRSHAPHPKPVLQHQMHRRARPLCV